MLKLATALSITTMLIAPATARTWHHGHHIYHHRLSENVRHRNHAFHRSRPHYAVRNHWLGGQHLAGGGRPREWCGWELRHELGVADRSYNLARNWAHYGSPAGGPASGVIVVWSHHVGRIEGECSDGEWLVHSGNDGGAVRTRCRSVRGAIAFRYPGFGGYAENTAVHYRQFAAPHYARRHAGYGAGDGIASVYRGGRTADGEWAHASGFTAASPTLPFGTRVRVTNVRNGRSVVVRINDRGPFVHGRIIDLMPAAAHAIGASGLADVRVSRL